MRSGTEKGAPRRGEASHASIRRRGYKIKIVTMSPPNMFVRKSMLPAPRCRVRQAALLTESNLQGHEACSKEMNIVLCFILLCTTSPDYVSWSLTR